MKSLIHCLKVLIGIDHPETQVTHDETETLQKYARTARTIVELGCFEGKTTIALAQATTGHVYTVDPFVGGRVGICYGKLIAKSHRRRSKVENVTFIQDFSHRASLTFDRKVDMVFIDADHSYDAIKQDWSDWFPKVRVGGIIALHDSKIAPNSPDASGSKVFYAETISQDPGVEVLEGVDSLAVVKKLRSPE